MKLLSPLSLFIVVSVAIHAAVVMVSNNTPTIALPSTTGNTITIKIKKTKHAKVQQAVKTIASASTTSTSKTVNQPLQKNTKPEQQQKKADFSSLNTSEESKTRVISILYQELHQYFNYPKLAQKRNWQGKVLLSLRVSTNGNIDNVQVSHSSGHSILDDAAINSLLKVKTLPKISLWLANDININIPVIYQLTEG